MYRSLHTNIPNDLMAYGDHPFLSSERFPSRQEVLRYLEDYGDEVREHIRFGVEVTSARKVGEQWHVQTRDIATREETTQRCDCLVLAHGHYDFPYIPETEGLDDLIRSRPGTVSHSKYYRVPERFAGEKVLVIGGGPSGQDIANQLVGHAASVYRAHRGLPGEAWQQDEFGVVRIPEVCRFDDGFGLCVDDSRVTFDRVILCTGYRYSTPFLHLDGDSNCAMVHPSGKYLDNLYRQLVYIFDPTLAILTQGKMIVPFPIAQAQSCYMARIWSGRLRLPEHIVMLEASDAWKASTPPEKLMSLGHPLDGDYMDALRRDCLSAGPGGMLPVDWMRERFELRGSCADLKLLDRRRRRDEASSS